MAAPSLDLTPRSVRVRGLPAIPTSATTPKSDQSRDFWIPQVAKDGQIYYINTLTGKLSRDLPRDSDGDFSDGDLLCFSAFQPNARTGGTDEPAFVPVRDVIGLPHNATARRQMEAVVAIKMSDSTPSSLSLPSPSFRLSDTPQTQPVKPLPLPIGASRARANTALARSPVNSRPNRALSFGSKPNYLLEAREAPHIKEPTFSSDVSSVSQRTPRPDSRGSSTLTARQSLAPPAPELVSELLERARQRIQSVILQLKQFGIPQVARDEEIVDDLICAAVTAIRDLLYVSGPSFQHLEGRNKTDRDTSNASQTPLVPAQRRAIATLSKFVLSARAVLNDRSWIAHGNVSQLSSDADELDRSVVEFVSIAQGVRSQVVLGPRRMYGYLTAPHAGTTNPGAGTAGTWRGFGWVDVEDDEEAPRRNLTKVTFNEFVSHMVEVQERLNMLTEVLRETQSAEVVATSAQELFKQLSSLVVFLGDIHIARHVDVETIDETKLSDGAQYMRTVEKARVLIRSFEATTQAMYDDGAALFLATQRVQQVEPCESWIGRNTTYGALETLSASLDFNLKISRQNLEGLLQVGDEQSAILERCHQSPVEWRMSQRSLVSAILANRALEAMYENHDADDSTTDEPERILKSVSEDVGEPHSPITPRPVPPPVPTSGKLVDILRKKSPVQNVLEDDETLEMIRTPLRQHKIKAFFGDDAPSHYLISLSAEAKPWYLRPQYNPDEVLIDPDGTVRGGTIPALVERLTAHEYADTNFTRAFLMTFKSFMTLDELFNLLVERFWIQPPPDLSPEELGDWRYNKQNIIRIRVINTMKLIVQDEDTIEKEELEIVDRIAKFASGDDVFRIAAAKPLLAAIKRVHGGNVKKVTLQSSVSPPAPIVPKRIELLDIDPLELARQLTITESQLYLKIQPSECLQRSKQSKKELHDGVANFIRRSNSIAQWVTYSILCKDEPRRRAAIMKQFILVADRCRVIQNFSTMMAIVTGLNSSPIHRLKRSWEQVNSRYMSQLETCETIINSYKRYNSYRSSLAALAPPCVPFVGVFLTALTHIQDGSKDYLPGDLINFRKRQKSSEVVQDLQRWQNQPHNFHPLPSVLVFIHESLSQFGDHDASEVFWKLSLEREPREKDEEKLSKWLSESGFF